MKINAARIKENIKRTPNDDDGTGARHSLAVRVALFEQRAGFTNTETLDFRKFSALFHYHAGKIRV